MSEKSNPPPGEGRARVRRTRGELSGPSASPEGSNVELSATPDKLPGTVELPPEGQVRRGLAFFVLWLVVGVVAAGFTLVALTPVLGLNQDSVDSVVQLFFTAIITLAGTVFGFYFASRNSGG